MLPAFGFASRISCSFLTSPSHLRIYLLCFVINTKVFDPAGTIPVSNIHLESLKSCNRVLLSPVSASQGNRGRTGVVVAAYMHYSNISARYQASRDQLKFSITFVLAV